jgi:hypothetical protein
MQGMHQAQCHASAALRDTRFDQNESPVIGLAMKRILHFLSHLADYDERRERRRREAYLAEAIDVYDLEQGMRELDRQSTRQPSWLQSPL